MKPPILLIITYLILADITALHADNLRRISSREGISNNSVLSLAQDPEGYIWFGTCDGLDLWDGEAAVSYPDKDSGMQPLSGNLIEEIISTEDCMFWVRTNYGLDLMKDNAVIENHGQFQGIYLAVSRRSWETLVFTPGDRLYGYARSSGTFQQVQWPEGIHFYDILDVCISEEDIAWIFCTGGIFYSEATFQDDGSAASIGNAKAASGSRPLKSAFRKDEGVYIVDEESTLYLFDTDNGQMDRITSLKKEISEYGPVSDIARYGNGYMISFLYNGVTRLIPSETGRGYDSYRLDIDCGVFSLLKDRRQDIVWIGTDGQGVVMYAYNPTTFHSYTYDRMPYNLSKPARSILLDSERTLWIGTKGEGILRVPDFTNGQEITHSNSSIVNTSNSRLADESVYALEESSHGMIWIGTEGDGINYYSYDTGEIHSLSGKIPEGLRYVHGIHEIGDTLWVATVGLGVYKLELGFDSMAPYIRKSEKLDFGPQMENMDFFFCLYEDKDGTLLFGNRGGGLAIYDYKDRKSEVIRFDMGRSAVANDVWALCRGRQGDLWIGTSYGLLKISGKDGKTRECALKRSIHGILEGKNGELWISTNRGIVKYLPESDKYMTYGYSYGINTIEYSDGAYFTDPVDDVMYFGGTNGFVTVSSQADKGSSFNPPLVFRSIQTKDYKKRPEDALGRKGKLILGPHDRLYEISVDALDYIDGGNYIYSYCLKGYDSDWNQSPKRIRFADLPPGHYTLQVKYTNPVNEYTSPVSSIEIRIRHQWYASTVAKISYLIISAVFLLLISRILRNRRRKQRKEQIEKEQAKRKEEMLNSTVQLFENISQELTMPLTMISGPCQQILEYDKSDKFIRLHSEKIMQQSNRLFSILRIFHEFSESNDSEQLQVQMFSVSDTAEDIARTFEHHAENRGIAFNVEITRPLVWSSSSREISTAMETLLTNAFINVENNGRIDFRVWAENDMLKITVSNDCNKSDPSEIAEMLRKFGTMEYPLSRISSGGLSFKNEMRLALCWNIAVKLNGSLKLDFNDETMKFTMAVPSISSSDESGNKAISAVNSIPDYIAQQDNAQFHNVNIYKEPLQQFDFIKERLMMFIIGKDAEIMNFIAELFTSSYNIRMFNDCAAAQDALHAIQPEIIICEYLSTRSDILNTIKAVKSDRLTSHIPVILLSGTLQSDDRLKGIESGADTCISLPFDIKYLRANVEQLLNRLKTLQDYYQSSISSYQFTYGKMLHREDKEFVDKMLRIISENISDSSVTTAFIAEKMGVSVRTLYHKLEGLINVTPNNIIKEYRLMYAEQLLTTTKLSIDEIIYKSGFSNRGTFFKNFSAKYGCTPKAYRESQNKGMGI